MATLPALGLRRGWDVRHGREIRSFRSPGQPLAKWSEQLPPFGIGVDEPIGGLAVSARPFGVERDAAVRDDPRVLARAALDEARASDRLRLDAGPAVLGDVHRCALRSSGSVRTHPRRCPDCRSGRVTGTSPRRDLPYRFGATAGTRRRPSPVRSVVPSRVRAGSRTCGDVWFRQGPATGEREPRTPLGLVNHVAKRSTWQPPVDSRPRCLGSKVSVEAASASRVVEASCSEAAIRTSVT